MINLCLLLWSKYPMKDDRFNSDPISQFMVYTDKQKQKEYLKKWYLENKDRVLKERKIYRESSINKLKIKKYNQGYRIKNKAKIYQWKKDWFIKNKDKKKIYQKRYELKLKEKVYEGYGNKCNCCGEKNWLFLTVDHIMGGGNKERRKNKSGWVGLYVSIINNNFPNIYQILCMNCNHGKYRNKGICPHQVMVNV